MNGQHLSHMFYITNEVNKLAVHRMRSIGLDDLVITHGFILEMLYRNEGKMAMKDLALGISRTKSTVTQLVEKLMKYDLVRKERCELDRRYHYIHLTEKGYAYKDDLVTIITELSGQLYANLTSEALKQCGETLDTMNRNLKEK